MDIAQNQNHEVNVEDFVPCLWTKTGMNDFYILWIYVCEKNITNEPKWFTPICDRRLHLGRGMVNFITFYYFISYKKIGNKMKYKIHWI